MRSFGSPFSFITFLWLAIIFCAVPWSNAATVDPTCDSQELGCRLFIPSRQTRPTQTFRKPLTNAERFREGLPPLPPTRRAIGARGSKASPSPSPTPHMTYRGVIQVLGQAGTSLGYVFQDSYYTLALTGDITAALTVEFDLNGAAVSGTQLALRQLNQDFPLLGLIQGRESTSASIGPGSFNYLYFGGVASPGTPPGSAPQDLPNEFSANTGFPDRASETSVWNINLVTGAVTVQWVNPDLTTPTTQTFVQSNHLYAGGDAAAFFVRFPAPVNVVTLLFVPI